MEEGPLHLETLEQARAWMERRNWDATLTIDRPETQFYCGMNRERVGFMPRQETEYYVNGRPSDAHTVVLLRQAAIERNERHAAAFEAGVEQGQVLSAMREHLDSLDCPMDVQVREGYCNAESQGSTCT